jgi:hypothetical protein
VEAVGLAVGPAGALVAAAMSKAPVALEAALEAVPVAELVGALATVGEVIPIEGWGHAAVVPA